MVAFFRPGITDYRAIQIFEFFYIPKNQPNSAKGQKSGCPAEKK
jgi:hypothetical protein